MFFRYKIMSLFLLLSLNATAQIDTSKSKYGYYYFDKDDVVFEFDRRAYEAAMHSTDSSKVDFADLEILEVVVAGNADDWSKDDWVMKKVDEYHYQLRKKRVDFKDAPNWRFKFLINGDYWTTPDSVFEKKGWLGRYDAPVPDNLLPVPSDTGQVGFHLKGHLNAKTVILTGSFNNWDEHLYKMRRDATGWTLRLSLAPREYEYKFIVDGEWMHDPANPEKRINQYDTYNSILRLTKTVNFELRGFNDAKTVILAGSFNNWDEHSTKMQRTASGWKIELPLASGKHTYKFIVDGQWMHDPANPRLENDRQGNENSVLFVR